MMTHGKRIYVLDTNVLMHDPTALFRFEEHDVFLPMQVIEELDNGKKGTSEASRNARQVSRFINELIEAQGTDKIASGLVLERPNGLQLRGPASIGKLRFQTTVPTEDKTSTFRHRDFISLTSTLKDSGMPGSGMFAPLTIAS